MIQYEVLIVVSHRVRPCEIRVRGRETRGRYPIKNERAIYQRLCVQL